MCSRSTKQIFLKFFQISQGNTCAGDSIFNKFAGLQPATLFKKRLQHRCFPVNFAKLLIIIFKQNASDLLHPRQNFHPHHSRFYFWPTSKFYGPTLSTSPMNPSTHATHATQATHATHATHGYLADSEIHPTWGGYFYSFKQVNFSFFFGGGRGGVSAPLHAMDIFSILFSDFNSIPALPVNILPCFSCWTILVLLFFLTP